MGRRILLNLAILLSASSTAPGTHGQDPCPKPPPEEPAPRAVSEAPVPIPRELTGTADGSASPEKPTPPPADKKPAAGKAPF